MATLKQATDWPIVEIPLFNLTLSPDNVRKDGTADAAALDELAASLLMHGQIQNLVVSPHGDDGYQVISGARRLAAFLKLAQDRKIADDFPVLCRVIECEGDEAAEISLAENVVRIAMHPIDQVEAFAKLVAGGMPVQTVAARFGVSERIVERRLRLADVAPDILALYRDGKLHMDTLEAFTVVPDQKRQMEVWNALSGKYNVSAWSVRQMLTDDRISLRTAVGRFVGVEAYEAAGGTVTRDLFDEEDGSGVWLDDGEIVQRLALEKLEAKAVEVRTKWKWAHACLTVDWEAYRDHGRVYAEPGQATKKEDAAFEKLGDRMTEILEGAEEQGGDVSDKLQNEWDDLATKQAAIREKLDAREKFTTADMKRAGCLVSLGHGGDFRIEQGFVAPDDKEQTAGDPGEPTVPATSGQTQGPKPEQSDRKALGIDGTLEDDLRSIRSTLVKAHLSKNFRASFDLFVFQACCSVFNPIGLYNQALDITVKATPMRPGARANEDDFAAWNPGEAMLADRADLSLDWMEERDRGKSFDMLRSLPMAEKQKLFAAAVGRTLNEHLSYENYARPETEATIKTLNVPFARFLTWGEDLLWSRLRKDRCLEVARACLGGRWTDKRSKLKKGDLAAALHDAFSAEPTGQALEHVDAVSRGLMRTWLPVGFRAFDAIPKDDA